MPPKVSQTSRWNVKGWWVDSDSHYLQINSEGQASQPMTTHSQANMSRAASEKKRKIKPKFERNKLLESVN